MTRDRGRPGAAKWLISEIAAECAKTLAAILSTAEALSEVDPPSPMKEGLAVIRTETERAAELVICMEALGRTRSPVLEQVALAGVTRRALDLAGANTPELAVEVKTTIADDLPTVRGDYQQILQVVLNLIHTALDAVVTASDAERQFDVSVLPAGGQIEIAVEHGAVTHEFGDGTAPPDPVRAWEIEDGRLLGLPVTRALVKAHGGTLRIETTRAGGQRFVVVLPTESAPTG
jgi:nitrogen-specific signal transduction histidine kinase